jgi:subtilisin family serine protease
MRRDVRRIALPLAVAAACLGAAPGRAYAQPTTEVVVALDAPGLARAVQESRVLTASVRNRRLDLHSPTSISYLHELALRRTVVERQIREAIPSARVRWRYAVVLDGLAVALPRDQLPRLSRLPGIRHVYPARGYRAALDTGPSLIGADQLWGAPTLSTAGQGVKIGIIDDGIDQSHPFFDPAGYNYPPGFPKGQTKYATPKVIVARAFAPATTSWKNARLPFDPAESDHGTHVAGIAAGNFTTAAVGGGVELSGVAPFAYLGNYKALSTPSPFGLIENAGEVVAAVEAAVRDGMDVINMSFGELETDPARNPVDEAVDGAAAAGVVPVAAAGNDYEEFGRGSVTSPGSATAGIAVAAVSKSDVLAPWSSSGPTPLSLRMKPDVSAPGMGILSSVPESEGTWSSFSGTSMASPHVAGAAALLIQRHPGWTVAQIKSALVLTGSRVLTDSGVEAPTTSEGGGLVDLVQADDPRIFAAPPAVTFGLVRAGSTAHADVTFSDAGGGSGPWTATARFQEKVAGIVVTVPPAVTVPGRLPIEVKASSTAPERDMTGFVVLQRSGVTRRVPFWLRVERPRLGAPARVLSRQGTYTGNTRKGRSLVVSYRYPDDPAGIGVSNTLRGPEQVFRVRLPNDVANFGTRVVHQAPGARVTPRIVVAGDENRLAGATALPIDVNPYRDSYGRSEPVAAVIRPASRAYDAVFDTSSMKTAGAFTFRLWVNDVDPPRVRLLTRTARARRLVLSVADSGSGVDPGSLRLTVDGKSVRGTLAGARLTVPLPQTVGTGRHRVAVTVGDYQETKNSENVLGILPNTTVFRATFVVR